MNKNKKITLGLIALGVVTATSFVATTAGSLAWYAYSRTITVSYIGTSVAKSVLLNVGIVDDEHYIPDNKLEDYELTREEYDGHSIVFTHSTNGLDYRAIRDYLTTSPYSVSMLYPLTTQDRAIDDDSALTLYKSPDYGDTVLTQEAKKSDYVKIPFAFRLDNKDGTIVNKEVWMTDSSIKADGENIDRAVRVFIEDKNKNDVTQRSFLMRPSDRSTTTGSTKVGGLLDLDGDGTYDFNRMNDEEYYYGKYTGTLSHESEKYNKEGDEAPYDNVNGVADEEKVASTFYAKHNKDAKLVKLNLLEPKVAEFETFGTVKPGVDASGNFIENTTTGIGKKITSTASPDGVGYATFTIFIEGWDHAVVDKAAGYSFNLGLKFEVNRLN